MSTMATRPERAGAATRPKVAKASAETAVGQCACGTVRIEIGVPARWAWHDHTAASRLAQGCAYATYVGSWRSRFRILKGARSLTRYEDAKTGAVRGFCAKCGTPLTYGRLDLPDTIDVTLGSMDDPDRLRPQDNTWTESRRSWIVLADGLPAYARERRQE